MEDVANAIELAFSRFKEEFGEDAKLEDGEEFVFQLNNCVLIIGVEDGVLRHRFIGDLPIKVDYTLKIYGSEEE